MPIDVFDRFHVPFKFDTTPPPPPPPPGDEKLYKGHYWKIFPGNVLTSTGAVNVSALNTIFNEIQASPACRGIKFTFLWGECENSFNTVSQGKGYVAAINYIAKRCWDARSWSTPRDIRMMLAVDIKGGNNINGLLPSDMIVQGGYTPGRTGYTPYTLAYPYTSAGAGPNAGTFSGYYPKVWKTQVQNRLLQFFQRLANHVPPNCDGKSLDQGDILAMFSNLESAPRNCYDTYQDNVSTDGDPVGSLDAHEQGVFDLVKKIKQAFPLTPVTMSLNYSRPYCAEIIPKLHALKIGINTPNINLSTGINTIDNSPPITNGILRYFLDPAIYNSLIINPEVQGDDFVSTYGKDARDRADAFAKQNPPNWTAVDAEYDFPDYLTLWNRFKELNAHYVVWQRESPFWNGGTLTESFKMSDGSTVNHTFPGTRPSFLATFFQTNSELNNPADVTGGVNSGNPTNAI